MRARRSSGPLLAVVLAVLVAWGAPLVPANLILKTTVPRILLGDYEFFVVQKIRDSVTTSRKPHYILAPMAPPLRIEHDFMMTTKQRSPSCTCLKRSGPDCMLST